MGEPGRMNPDNGGNPDGTEVVELGREMSFVVVRLCHTPDLVIQNSEGISRANPVCY